MLCGLLTHADPDRQGNSVVGVYDLEKCSAEYPLWVGILNESDDTVEKFSFSIEGHLEGYSDPLYDSGYSGYSSDRIIPSGEGITACWTLPRQAYV